MYYLEMYTVYIKYFAYYAVSPVILYYLGNRFSVLINLLVQGKSKMNDTIFDQWLFFMLLLYMTIRLITLIWRKVALNSNQLRAVTKHSILTYQQYNKNTL